MVVCGRGVGSREEEVFMSIIKSPITMDCRRFRGVVDKIEMVHNVSTAAQLHTNVVASNSVVFNTGSSIRVTFV